MKVYLFQYNYCVYESGYVTMSIHRTKAGAYKAMRKHRVDEFYEWYNSRIMYGKYSQFPYDFGKAWKISEETLID